jgi:hypothetical protein
MVEVARRLAVLACLVLLALPALGEDAGLSSWFRSDPKARAYAAVEAELAATFDAAAAADLPTRFLLEKLREGAAKGVAPARLAAGLRAEAQRLSQAADMLAHAPVPFPDRAAREETLKAVSIALLAGFSPGGVEALLARAAPPARGPQDVVAVLAAVIPVKDASRLEEPDLVRLGAALLGSRLPATAFKSVASFFLRAAASGARDGDILDTMVIPALEGGGGLVQMEEKLRVFQKRRGSR